MLQPLRLSARHGTRSGNRTGLYQEYTRSIPGQPVYRRQLCGRALVVKTSKISRDLVLYCGPVSNVRQLY